MAYMMDGSMLVWGRAMSLVLDSGLRLVEDFRIALVYHPCHGLVKKHLPLL